MVGSAAACRTSNFVAEDCYLKEGRMFFRGEIEKKRKPFGSFSEAFRKLFGREAFLFTLFCAKVRSRLQRICSFFFRMPEGRSTKRDGMEANFA